MNLVIGSTGMLGMEICRRLRAAGQATRALVRRTSHGGKRQALQAIGTELVEGDLKDPASLRSACAGVEAVISTASSTFSRREGDSIETVDRQGQIALIDAARSTGVARFVFISYRDDPRIQYPLTEAKRAVEARLRASGLAYTIIQASFFMEIWLTPALGFDPIHGKVRVCGDGTGRVSWVSFKDVAEVAVGALRAPGARNATLEVGGPEALSPLEVVRMFEATGAAEITAEYVPEKVLWDQFAAARDPLQKSFAGLMLQCAAGDVIDISRTSALVPVRLTSVRDYVSAVMARA
jgi:uncharacterized protein YbjT (DUF2867 family)